MFPNAALSSHRISMSNSHKQSYPTSLHSLLNDDSQQDAYIFKLEKKNSPNNSSPPSKIPQKKNDYNKSYNFRPIKMISLSNEYQNKPTQPQSQPNHQNYHTSYRNHFNHELSHDRSIKSENSYNIGHNSSSNNSSTPNSNSSSNHSINPSSNNINNHTFHHNHSFNSEYNIDSRSNNVPDHTQNHHTTLKAITTSSSLSPPSKKRMHSISSYEDDYSHESGENNSNYHNSIIINSNITPHRNSINHSIANNNNHPHFEKLPKVPLSSISNSSNKSLNVAISPSINNITPQLNAPNMQMNSILTSSSSTSLNRFPVGSHEWQRIRRENHKQVERRRREHINAGVNLLSTLVPGCEKNKGKVLHQAAQYISQLKADEVARTKKFESEINEYKLQISKLQDQIKQLHKNLNP
ncbi:putative bHLH domain-containing protein [Smittium culicis]|uniref:Putative bHLH domain-containing protein n=1 Tax=Smittium culicis TaxID=133412 RepID=A0A1R1XF67_9FUNG|nr:putative bHLH domain-containing protein [Smittium culicis]